MDVLNMILPIVYIVVGLALVWFLVELVLTIRRTRTVVADVHKQIEPTLDNVQQLTEEAKPLMERVSLTVDAANLEIMRVDGILQDVNQITDTATRAVETVDNVANAPMDLVNSLASKVRSKLGPKQASDVSKRMGRAKAEEAEAMDDAMLSGIDADLGATGSEPANKGYTSVTADIDVPAGTEAEFPVPAKDAADDGADPADPEAR